MRLHILLDTVLLVVEQNLLISRLGCCISYVYGLALHVLHILMSAHWRWRVHSRLCTSLLFDNQNLRIANFLHLYFV